MRICTEDYVGNLANWNTLYIFKYNESIDVEDEDPIEINDTNKSSERDNNINNNDEIIPGYEIYLVICVICVISVIQINKLLKIMKQNF